MKNIFFILIFFFSSNAFSENKVYISQNFNEDIIQKVENEKNKYKTIINEIYEDIRENSIYLKSDKPVVESGRNPGEYKFNVKLQVFLKKNVIKSNIEKALVIKHKRTLDQALKEIEYKRFFNWMGWNKDNKICLIYNLYEKNKNYPIKTEEIFVKETLTIYDFFSPELYKENLSNHDIKSWKNWIEDEKDLLIIDQVMINSLTLDQISKIDYFSVEAINCR